MLRRYTTFMNEGRIPFIIYRGLVARGLENLEDSLCIWQMRFWRRQ